MRKHHHAAEGAAAAPQTQEQPKPPFPARKLDKPGLEKGMDPQPRFWGENYRPAGKLVGRHALVTGGDSGIGRSVAVLFAREGAKVAINYLPREQADADETRRHVESAGGQCVQLPGDLRDAAYCQELVESARRELGELDLLISNAAHQDRHRSVDEISDHDWEDTFRTNIDALFYLVRAAVPQMRPGSSIIVTSSETGLFGNRKLLDYSATKGAINAFVKALAQNVLPRGIRVNAVAPGPVWTPLNLADEGQPAGDVSHFGERTPMGRPAQPEEIAPAYVFLASEADSSYLTGHVLPLLGGEIAGS